MTPLQLFPLPVTVSRRAARHPGRALSSLTGLRAVAAGLVFVYHLRNMGYFAGGPQDTLTLLFGGGAAAVSLFFILSGFVLGWSHRRGTGIATVWWRRALRIFPVHVVGVALALLVAATAYPGIRTTDSLAGLANLFLISGWRSDWWQAGNPVSWSLVCEAFFYLLFPFLIRVLGLLNKAAVIGIAAMAVVLTWLLPTLVPVLAPAVSPYSNPMVRLPEFVFGVALAVLMRHHGWRGAGVTLATVIAGVGMVAATITPTSPYAPASFTIIGFGLLITALARRDLAGQRTGLGSRVAVMLGERSYAFYIVHLLVLQTILGLLPALTTSTCSALIAAVAAAVVAVGVADLLHRGVERPLVEGLRGLPARLSSTTSVTSEDVSSRGVTRR